MMYLFKSRLESLTAPVRFCRWSQLH